MNFTEYRVIDESNISMFIKELDRATEDGFKVISSNHFIVKHESYNHPPDFETLYYALMVKNQFQESNNSHNFQYSVLDELKKIKLELREIVENLKYLGE